jgi:uncharacterized protein YndB with AHSA1/START domain
MIRKILLVLVVLAAVLAVVVYLQPDDYVVERSTVIPAPASDVFPLVNDFHRWNAWSPWEKIDPNMKRTIDGSPTGKGAKYAWIGNKEVGEGSMTITESKPNELILIDLKFVKPMEGQSLTEFKFAPEGTGTKVTWKMSGKNNFVGKAMCLVMNMDKMVGGQFETGLMAMKLAATAPATPAATGTASPTPTGATPTGPALK